MVVGGGAATIAMLAADDSTPRPAVAVTSAAGLIGGGGPSGAEVFAALTPRFASPRRVAAARRFAAGRDGAVSFAVFDADRPLRGRAVRRTFVSASLVKAMLLVAHLREHRRVPVEASAAQLDAMIRISDNDAADSVYYGLGDGALYRLSERAGLRDFSVAGYWANAQLSARDMARFFGRLGRLLPPAHRRYGLRLLSRIDRTQSWGIPAALGRRWRVSFKGGWRPTDSGQLVHQAALLRDRRSGRGLGLAVLTDGNPSMEYGIETVEGIATRLAGRRR